MTRNAVRVGTIGCLVSRDGVGNGYGVYHTDDGQRKHVHLHSLVYAHLENGGQNLCSGMNVAHTCDTEGCINRDHLQSRSSRQNWEDRATFISSDQPDMLQYLPDRDGIMNKKSNPTQALVQNEILMIMDVLEESLKSLKGETSDFEIVDGGASLSDDAVNDLIESLESLLNDPDALAQIEHAKAGGAFDLQEYQKLPGVADRKKKSKDDGSSKKRSATAAFLDESSDEEGEKE